MVIPDMRLSPICSARATLCEDGGGRLTSSRTG
jgi:hypothetical protein